MKPATAACCVLLILLPPCHTGTTVNPSLDQSSALLDNLKKLLEVKDEPMRREVNAMLEALLRALSQCKDQVNTTPASKDPMTTPSATTSLPSTAPPIKGTTVNPSLDQSSEGQVNTTPASKDPMTTPSATTSLPSTAPPIKEKKPHSDIPLEKKKQTTHDITGNQHSQRPQKPGNTRAPSNDHKGNEESQGSPKSDRKFLWIVLGALGVIMFVTILILKRKVLICARTHTKADVADYMEEKVYGKNDDVVLLGVTPGSEGDDDFYFSKGCDGLMSQATQQGCPGYEDISPRSTY